MKFNFETIGIGSLPYQNIEIAFEKTLKNFAKKFIKIYKYHIDKPFGG